MSRTINSTMLVLLTLFLGVQIGISRDLKVRNYHELVPISEIMPTGLAQSKGAPSSSIQWENPEGWESGPASNMRLGTLVVDNATQCSIIALGGKSGSLEANVKRWIQQAGITDLEDSAFKDFMNDLEEVEAKDGIVFKVVDITRLSKEGSSILGAIAVLEGKTLFVKLTGTLDKLNGLKRPFMKLLKSFQYESSEDTHQHGTTPADVTHAPAKQSSPLSWRIPKAWKEVSGSTMRLVSFQPEATDGTECYITLMGGDAGGLERNIQWWGSQLGITLSQAEIADIAGDLESVEVDNVSYQIIDYGALVLSPTANSMMVAVGFLPSKTVFVKMTGSKEGLAFNRGSFMDLVTSIEHSAN